MGQKFVVPKQSFFFKCQFPAYKNMYNFTNISKCFTNNYNRCDPHAKILALQLKNTCRVKTYCFRICVWRSCLCAWNKVHMICILSHSTLRHFTYTLFFLYFEVLCKQNIVFLSTDAWIYFNDKKIFLWVLVISKTFTGLSLSRILLAAL